MARFDLKLVDENFTADAKAPRDDMLKAHQAAGIREGKRRAHEALADTINKTASASAATLTQAHTAELERSGRIIARAAHRDGMLQGIVTGMLLAIGLAFATWVILREVVITNVATQRVPIAGDGVPELRVPPYQEQYERNRREPPDAAE